jgi:hypothetical protein
MTPEQIMLVRAECLHLMERELAKAANKRNQCLMTACEIALRHNPEPDHHTMRRRYVDMNCHD